MLRESVVFCWKGHCGKGDPPAPFGASSAPNLETHETPPKWSVVICVLKKGKAIFRFCPWSVIPQISFKCWKCLQPVFHSESSRDFFWYPHETCRFHVFQVLRLVHPWYGKSPQVGREVAQESLVAMHQTAWPAEPQEKNVERVVGYSAYILCIYIFMNMHIYDTHGNHWTTMCILLEHGSICTGSCINLRTADDLYIIFTVGIPGDILGL